VELGPQSHASLFEALDQYRGVQKIPPLPPFSELKKRLDRLAVDPSRFEKILQITPGEYSGIDQRKFRVSRNNVNHHLVRFLLAAGADLAGPPSHEQIAYASESAESLHRAARSGGESTSGRPDTLGLSDLIASAIEIQRDAGGRGVVWQWSELSNIYEGFLFDLINFLLSSCLLVDHLEELNAAAPQLEKTCASWGTFHATCAIPDPVISEETVRQYLRKTRR